MDKYDITLGNIEVTVAEYKYKIKISHRESGYLLYSFKRANPDGGPDEPNPILRPKNINVSSYLFDLLDDKYGMVLESVTIHGTELTCECDNPMLQFERHWSDGMKRHHLYKCINCDNVGAAHSNYKDELTSAGPWVINN